MSPFLKKFLIIVFGLAGLLAAALAFIAVTFDPNDYKDQIQTAVKDQTGRDLNLGGPLQLSVFPWLGVAASDVSLSNAEGFEGEHFAAIESLQARLQLLPLLSGEIRLGLITLHGLSLNLQRRSDGSANWDDLAAPSAESTDEAQQEQQTESSQDSDMDFTIAGLELSNAKIRWQDGDAVTLVEGLNLRTGPVAEGEASNLALDVAVTLADATQLQLDLESDWQFDLAGPSARLSDFEARLSASGPAVPAQKQELNLSLAAEFDGAAQQASVREGVLQLAGEAIQFSLDISELDQAQKLLATLDASGLDVAKLAQNLAIELPPESKQWPELDLALKADGTLAAKRLNLSGLDLSFGALQAAMTAQLSDFAAPAGRGELQIQPLDLHAFLAALGYPLEQKQSAGPTSLTAALEIAPDRISIKPIKGQLAGEALAGSVSVSNFAKPAIRADLDLAGMKLADWSGEESEQQAQASKSASSEGQNQTALDEMQVPMDWAKELDLTARVALSRLNAYGVKFRDVRWSADARPGKPVRQELVANAYGGQMSVKNSIDPNQPEPVIGMNMSAKAIGLGDLLQDGWGSRWISGTTELGMNLSTQGSTVGKLKSQANGDANYRLKDGEVQGFSLLDVIRKAEALVSGAQPAQAEESTAFSELVGQFLIDSGRLKLKTMSADNDWFDMAGDGVIDLLGGRYDMTLKPTLRDNPRVKQDKNLSRLIGLALPVSVSGPLNAPKFKLDVESALKQKAKQEVDKELDKQKDKLREKLNDKLGDFFRSR